MSGFVISLGFVAVMLVIARLVHYARAHDRIIRKIDALLTCWAENWTEDPETIRCRLQAVVDACEDETPPRQSLGLLLVPGLERILFR